jgi:predicted metal-dependent HD superfamily phosphohydrolase
MEKKPLASLSESRQKILLENWQDLTQNSPAREAGLLFEELSRLYSSPHRAYHNLHHIVALLEQARRFETRIDDFILVGFAIWFHDAVYDTRKKDNEERSAEYAVSSLARLQSPASQVRDLILATRKHDNAGLPPDGALFLDFDLSILGVEPGAYEKYAAAIREEYSWVPSLLYRRERRKVLKSFLRRDRIYFTDVMFDLYEAPARHNIETELAAL